MSVVLIDKNNYLPMPLHAINYLYECEGLNNRRFLL